MISRVESASSVRDIARGLQVAVELTKPGVTRLVLLTMLAGALIVPIEVDWGRLLIALSATAMVVAASNALNMFRERDVDALMTRTQNRPLPTGRITPEVALWFGLILGAIGLLALLVLVNVLSMLLALLAMLSYVLVYTPLKRASPLALHVGAVPGAIPPLIGWASLMGNLTVFPLTAALILLVWQIPHFLAISIFRQTEYERAGLRVYSAVNGVTASKYAMVRYLAVLLAVSQLPAYLGYAGAAYAVLVGGAGLCFLGYGLWGLRRQSSEVWAKRVFLLSMPYLVLVLLGLVLSAQ